MQHPQIANYLKPKVKEEGASYKEKTQDVFVAGFASYYLPEVHLHQIQ